MASYTRQSTFSDGDLITAALFNDEYNQLLAAFDNATGHKHDGTVGEGPVISVLGDAGLATPLNKILVDTTNDHIEFWIDVSGTSTQQLYIADGAIVPVTDNDIDLGTNSLQFKDLYINGTANIDNLAADSATLTSATLTTADINGGNIDGTVIGATTAAAGTFTTINASSNVVISGNLTVSGTTTSVNSNEVNIGDNIIVLNSDETGTPSQNAGIEIERGTSTNVSLLWNEGSDYWTFGSNDLNFPDSSKAKFGTGNDLEIYHDGSNSYVADRGTGNLRLEGTNIALNNQTSSKTYLLATDGGSVQLRHNDATKFETTSTGIDVTGNATFDDNGKAIFGTGGDLEIYHSGATSFIKDAGVGNLEIWGDGGLLIKSGDGTEFKAKFLTNDAVELYYNNAKKFETTSTGIDVTGNVVSNGIDLEENTSMYAQDATLSYYGSTNGVYLNGAGNDGWLRLNASGASNDANAINIFGANVGIGITFKTASTERARIDASGNLLIGTTNDFPPGDTGNEGVAIKPDNIAISRNNSTVLFLDRMTNDGVIVDLRKDNTSIGKLRSYSSDLIVQNAGTGLRFNDGNNTIHPVVSAGSVSDNLTDLGLSNARFKDLHLGGTVNFGSLSDGTITITGFVDEDNMSSNSATLLPTQQSVKAYVDSQISSAGGNGISFEDNEKAQFGDGNDLQIYHDGSNSYIVDAGTGDLIIQAGNDLILNDPNSTEYLRGNQGAGVEVKHNGSTKLLTTSTGVDVTGTVTADGLDVDGSGDISGNTYVNSGNGTGTALKVGGEAGNGIKTQYVFSGSSQHNWQLGFATHASQTFSITPSSATGNTTFTTPILNLDGANARVGIGTSTPTETLHVMSGVSNDTVAIISGSQADRGLTISTYASDGRTDGGVDFDAYKSFKFTTDGSERVRIDSIGRLGIGTSSPSTGMHLSFGDSKAELTLERTGTNASSWGLKPYNGDFFIRESGTDRVTIKAGGKVGIGTTAPGYLLSLSDSDGADLHFSNSSTLSDGDYLGRIYAADSSNNFFAGINMFYHDSNDGEMRFRIKTAGTNTDVMTLVDGRVGIGDTTPDAKLTVQGDVLARDEFRGEVVSYANNQDAPYLIASTSGYTGATTNWNTYGFQHRIKTDSSGVPRITIDTHSGEVFTVTNNNRVGVGTTSPSHKLTVEGTTSPTTARVKTTTGNANLRVSTDNSDFAIIGQGGSNRLDVYDNNGSATRLSLDSSGNFLIGKTSSSTGVAGARFSANGFANVTRDGAECINFNRLTSNGTIIDFRKDSSTIGIIGTDSNGQLVLGSGDTGLSFQSNNDAIIPRNTDGTARTGLINLGTTGAKFKDLHLSGNANLGSSNYLRFTASSSGSDASVLFGNSSGTGGSLTFKRNSDSAALAKINGTGQLLVTPLGVSTPSFAFTNDTNTGMTRPTGDTLQFVTAGSERVRITDAGNFGIGNSSPSSPLSVHSALPTGHPIAEFRSTGNVNATIDLRADGTGDPKIFFDLNGATPFAIGVDNSDSDKFKISGNYQLGTNDRFVIDSSGNVGIGTSSPDAPLTVHNSSDPEIRFGYSSTQDHKISWDSSKVFIEADPDNANGSSAIGFRVDGSEKARIDSNGRLGINTSSPDYPLSVLGAASFRTDSSSTTFGNHAASIRIQNKNTTDNNYAGITFDGSTNTAGAIQFQYTDQSGSYGDITFESRGSSGYSEKMRITSTGRLGLNTTNPTTDLEVNASGANGIKITSDQPYLFFNDTDNSGTTYDSTISYSGDSLYIGGASAASIVRFRNKASFGESARFDTSGNFLVGTTDSSLYNNTTGVGVAIHDNHIQVARSGGVPLYLNRQTSDGTISEFRKDGSTVGRISTTGGDLLIGTGDCGIRFSDGGDQIRVCTDTGTNRDGAIDLGYSDSRFKDLYLSGKAQADTYQFAQNSSAVGVTDAIYRATTSTIAFKTGSSERMRLNTTGLGIGTSSPSSALTVVGDITVSKTAAGSNILSLQRNGAANAWKLAQGHTATDYFEILEGNDVRLTIQNGGRVGVNGGTLNLGTADSSSGHINAYENMSFNIDVDNDDTTRYFSFHANGSDGSGSELMRLTESGNLGIGESSPDCLVHIKEGTKDSTVLKLENYLATANGAAYANYQELLFAAGGSGPYSSIRQYANGWANSDTALAFWTQDHGSSYAERMRIDGDGNVGINTPSPSEKLTVTGNQNITGKLAVGIANAHGSFDFYNQNTAYFNGAVTIDDNLAVTSGSVGIGETSPEANLHIKNASAGTFTASNSQLLIENNTTVRLTMVSPVNNACSIEFGDIDDQNVGVITYDHTANYMNFKTNASNAMRIDSSGNLLVGTTSAANSSAGFRAYSGGNGAFTIAGTALSLNRLSSDGEILNFQKDTSTKGNIGSVDSANGVQIYIASGNSSSSGVGLRFVNVTTSNYIAPVRGDGSYLDDTVDLGASSVRFDDIYATNGTIQTSDRNEKQDIQALTDAEQRVATACKGLIRRYKFNSAVTQKGDDARYHFGIIAQDLQDAFTAEGLDAGDYGMFISETWTDDNGVEQTRLGVRYNELLAFIIATL